MLKTIEFYVNREEISKVLKNSFKLSLYEAKTYLSLLEGNDNVKTVSRDSGVPLPRIYDTLRSLEDKGFVKKKNKKYTPVEPEIAFRFNADLIPKNSPFGVNDIIESVDAIYPAIEIVDCRYAKGWPIGILPTVADNGVHAAFVIGEEVADWRTLNRPEIPVVAKIDGNVFTDGTAANVLDDPLNALVWLANSCTSRGQSIKVREIVTTGNTVRDPIFVKPGNTVVATFGDIGSVEVSFV